MLLTITDALACFSRSFEFLSRSAAVLDFVCPVVGKVI